jgi:hypothetical protein
VVVALWLPRLAISQKRMGFIHLGHEVIINEPLIAGSQHLWVLSASEVRQNDLCTSHDGYLLLEWWARTQQPASTLGRVSLLTYLDATSKGEHNGGIEGPMDHEGLAFDPTSRGSVVQRTVHNGASLLNKTRVIIFVSNTNLNQSSSDPVGYTMLASCLSSSMLKCPRGGSGFRPCTGMGSHYNGSCILNAVNPGLSNCACTPRVEKQDCVPVTEVSVLMTPAPLTDSTGPAVLTIGNMDIEKHHINGVVAASCLVAALLVLTCFGGKAAVRAVGRMRGEKGMSEDAIQLLPTYRFSGLLDNQNKQLGARKSPVSSDFPAATGRDLAKAVQVSGRIAVTLARLGGWGAAPGRKWRTSKSAFTHACVVCDHRFEKGDSIRALPCRHEMHEGCSNTWLIVRAECPACGIDICGNKD